jgi:hypothetical protein
MRVLKMLSGAMLLTALLSPAVQAQDSAETRRLTILTFSAPVQLPRMTLPAGKYRFEMADINNAAHTVRVLSEDGKKVFGTFSTIPTTTPKRDLRDTDTLVMFAERPAGQPQAAKEWYYPQRSTGEEFVYPKAQALALAQANRTSVASEDNGKVVRVEGNESTNAAAANNSQSQVAQNETPAPAPTRQPAPPSVGTAGQNAAPAPAPRPAPASARRLPRTASQLSLFELLSVLSIGAAFSVRQLRLRAAARK